MIDSKSMTDFLVKKKITANQLYLCHMLYVKDIESLQKYVKTEYKSNKGLSKSLAFKEHEVNDLLEKGYIIQTGSDNTVSDFEVTEKFYLDYYIGQEECGEQIWDTYPKLLVIDGVYQSTRTVDKDEILQVYYKRIKGSRNRHEFALNMTRHFKTLVSNGQMQGMGIEKWVKGENWDTIADIIGTAYDKDSLI